jgi:hypothetical protein
MQSRRDRNRSKKRFSFQIINKNYFLFRFVVMTTIMPANTSAPAVSSDEMDDAGVVVGQGVGAVVTGRVVFTTTAVPVGTAVGAVVGATTVNIFSPINPFESEKSTL